MGLNQPKASPNPAIKHKNSEANSTSTMARGRMVACRASVAVIFSSGMAHSKVPYEKNLFNPRQDWVFRGAR